VIDHADVEAYVIPAQLALAMFGMGATLKVTDFFAVARDFRGLILGLALQLLMVPLLAVVFIEVFALTPGWAVGLCLVAVVPGGAFSNLLTFLGRGNVALSISVTVTSTALCVITVPVLLDLIVSSYLPVDFRFPLGRVILEIGGYLLIPLIVGMVVYRGLPRHAERLARFGIRGAVILLIVIVVSSLRSGRIKIPEYGWEPPLIILAFGIVMAIITPHIARLLGRFDDDTVALSIEVVVRNVGVALLMIQYFFPGQPEQGHVLYSCLFFAGASGFFALPLWVGHRFGWPVVLGRKRYPRSDLPVRAQRPAR
jgi:BASS family bile acid:Na+ symporter